jgi:glycosyltransferase involved in cell wall biosynthesis
VTGSTVDASIIIPTYQRRSLLRECLAALAEQDYPLDRFEVIVVDDGSRDGTAAMVAALQPGFRLRVLVQSNSGAGAARNRGAADSQGRICIFLDDDVRADEGLVRAHVGAVDENTVSLGHMRLRLPRSAGGYARYLARWWKRHYARLARQGTEPTYADCYAGNLAVMRHRFQEVGGFATDLPRADDVELGFRLQRAGLRFRYTRDASSEQSYQKDIGAIAADTRGEGKGAVRVWQRHPEAIERLRLGTFGWVGPRRTVALRLLMALPWSASYRALDRVLLTAKSDPWYQLLHESLHWRGVRDEVDRDTWERLTHPPIVLMYHGFARPGEAASRYVVPLPRFASQLRWLRRRGYRVLASDELVAALVAHRLPEARGVVITVDDGYRDVLSALAVTGREPVTLFLVSGGLDGTNTWDADGPLGSRPLLGVHDLGRLPARVTLGAHTVSHRSLPRLDAATMRAEIIGSRDALSSAVGNMFRPYVAYPYGEHDKLVREAAAEAGFEVGFAVGPGRVPPAASRFALPRVEVRGTMRLPSFAIALALADSWWERRIPLWRRVAASREARIRGAR